MLQIPINSMDKQMKKYYLYWIKAKHHSDPFTEGYIGCSKQPDVRFRSHTTDNTNAGSKAVKEYVNEYGLNSVSMEILAEFDNEQEAKQAEFNYRPHHHIGWNFQKGGLHNPDCTEMVHSKETREKRVKSVKATRATRTYTSPFKGKSRWTEEQKALIGSYHKGKVISESHKQAITEKLSGANNKAAKQTAILDLETGKITIYGSLGEASRMTGIGHSALKSAKRDYLLNGAIRTMQKRFQLVPSQGKD